MPEIYTSSQDNELHPCKLALEDGTVVTGTAIGYRGESGGELCFNTSMAGYQEILTDPSYYGQMMMMTYPHIGNYGAMNVDMEASRPMVSGLVVRQFSHQYSNQDADESLDAFMKRFKLVGISGVETRALVRRIRSKGVMNSIVSSTDLDDESLVAKARDWPSMEGLELASRVTTEESFDFTSGEGMRIAVVDYGVKRSILHSFESRGCAIRVFSAATSLEEILSWNPDGLFFSNGPGDPRAMPESIDLCRNAFETGIPMFGICLGHQLMSLAAGLSVYKMYVGHRGANHPVKNLITGKVEVSTQNHGFAVDGESLSPDIAELTHVNLNDQTVEGIRFKKHTAFSVQYHPEASPGPHDSQYLFDTFLEDIKSSVKVAIL
ncbi:MAG: carbamoyl-phosphate synthase small subunit [Bacteroidetes bacterium]|nr:MAG: carbamoyl-phosphate synthase small subunit [Bacteroidota bacterium]